MVNDTAGRLAITVVFFISGIAIPSACAQRLPLFSDPDLDSTYAEVRRERWSIRFFNTFRYHGFRLQNRAVGQSAIYRPNNRWGTGVGLAYRFLLLDLGFSIQLESTPELATERVDLQSTITFSQKHTINVVLQSYLGLDESSNDNMQPITFRKDLRSAHYGFDYMYNFNHRRLSLHAALAGDIIQKKSVGGFLFGGFMDWFRTRADSSITAGVPGMEDDLQAQIESQDLVNIGAQFGGAYALVLPANFYLMGGVIPGVGITLGKIHPSEAPTYAPKWVPAAKLKFMAIFAYLPRRYYLSLSAGVDLNYFPITSDQSYLYRSGMIKLAFGWRFSRKIKFLEEVNDRLERKK